MEVEVFGPTCSGFIVRLYINLAGVNQPKLIEVLSHLSKKSYQNISQH